MPSTGLSRAIQFTLSSHSYRPPCLKPKAPEVPNPPRLGLCSVVCTTYNHAAFSARSIQSIFDQTYREIEIVIIDDGSRDDNVAVMRHKLAKSPFPVTLIEQKNTGKIGMNLNRALDAVTGEYVCLLSLDDLLLPDSIASKIALLAGDETMMLVASTSYIEIDGADRMGAEPTPTPLSGKAYTTAQDMLNHEFNEIGTFFLQGALFRRAIIDAVGGYDTDMIGDDLILRTKIWLHMRNRPDLTFALQHGPGFIYRIHGQNIHKDSFRQLRTVIEWRDRYFPGRPLPDLFALWANHFFRQCSAPEKQAELQAAVAYSDEIDRLHRAYRRSWKVRRRAIKAFLKRKLGLSPQ
jgi:glycosyltransferase involved in cell wall biosynthesis